MLKKRILSVLNLVGLGKPARRVWQAVKASGYAPWEPLVPEKEFLQCVRTAIEHLRRVDSEASLGDYLEFGVSRGTSLACVHQALREEGLTEARLIGFDSFEGLPKEAAAEGWEEGGFHSTLSATRRYLASRSVDLSRVILVKGWFDDTLTEKTRARHSMTKASLIMVDCDIYSASRTALNFCEPLIQRHAVLIFDDWGWRADAGEVGQREAFEELMAEHKDLRAEPLPGYLPQSRVFLVTRTQEPAVTH